MLIVAILGCPLKKLTPYAAGEHLLNSRFSGNEIFVHGFIFQKNNPIKTFQTQSKSETLGFVV